MLDIYSDIQIFSCLILWVHMGPGPGPTNGPEDGSGGRFFRVSRAGQSGPGGPFQGLRADRPPLQMNGQVENPVTAAPVSSPSANLKCPHTLAIPEQI